MKRLRLTLFVPLLFGFACCGPEGQEQTVTPAIRITIEKTSAFQAGVSFNAVNTAKIAYGCARETLGLLPDTLVTGSTAPVQLSVSVGGLQPDTDYVITAVGIGPNGERSITQEMPFTTSNGPGSIYPWEKARKGVPVPADMTLIPGPSSHRTPLAWDKERWSSHVSYTDSNGGEHWLFDSFLLIEGQQTGTYGSAGHTYVLTESATPSAPRQLWQQLLDFWFKGGSFLQQESYWGNGQNSFGRWYTGDMVTPAPYFQDGQLSALDACIRETASRIGPPPGKRYVIMGLPEPIFFDNYIRAVNNTGSRNSIYWGELDGKQLDFSRLEDRRSACLWFIDETRSAFARKNYEYIELLGFYILPEVLSTTWRAEYKKYDELFPAVAEYLHSCNEGLFWIPYHLAEGYKNWRKFGIDMAYMQPNWYWYTEQDKDALSLSTTFSEINRYGMGLELEFEYSMVEAVNGASSAAMYRSRFDDYLKWARSSGVYGTRPIALYSGTDAMHQLASSKLPGDREMYEKLCEFIIGSPLRSKN